MSLTLETQLAAALQAVCPRVYPDAAPEGAELPYVVWTLYGGTATTYVEGALADRRNAFVQVNVWSNTRAESNTLMLQIELALVQHPSLQAMPMNALMASFDEDTHLRGAMQDFSIWANR